MTPKELKHVIRRLQHVVADQQQLITALQAAAVSTSSATDDCRE